jgi:hypothetical protein
MTQTLIPKDDEKRFGLELGYTLSCPIICVPSYEDSVTKEQKEQYRLEAMLHIREIFEKEEAPDYHAMIYLSHVSLMKPLGRTMTNVYLQLGRNYFKQLKEDEQITKTVHEWEDVEKQELTKLKQWIFKKQIEHLKSKSK